MSFFFLREKLEEKFQLSIKFSDGLSDSYTHICQLKIDKNEPTKTDLILNLILNLTFGTGKEPKLALKARCIWFNENFIRFFGTNRYSLS